MANKQITVKEWMAIDEIASDNTIDRPDDISKSKSTSIEDDSANTDSLCNNVTGACSTTTSTGASADASCVPLLVKAVTSGSSSSSGSIICRICQVSDSDESLEETRCHCKGYLSKCHRSCLVQWVRHKGSNKCELCGGTFSDIPQPEWRLGINQMEGHINDDDATNVSLDRYFQALEALRWQLSRFQPLSRRRRSGMVAVIVFLLLVTGVAAILTVSAEEDFTYINDNPWATQQQLEQSHIVFSICVSFVFFCSTLTVGLLLLWVTVECYYGYQRRRILTAAAQRMLAENTRDRHHGRTNPVIVANEPD